MAVRACTGTEQLSNNIMVMEIDRINSLNLCEEEIKSNAEHEYSILENNSKFS